MKRRPPRSTPLYSSAASDVYKRQEIVWSNGIYEQQGILVRKCPVDPYIGPKFRGADMSMRLFVLCFMDMHHFPKERATRSKDRSQIILSRRFVRPCRYMDFLHPLHQSWMGLPDVVKYESCRGRSVAVVQDKPDAARLTQGPFQSRQIVFQVHCSREDEMRV